MTLSNTRHEKFAQELAQGRSADEAYKLAGFKAHRGNASRLSANENILRRVSELQFKAALKVEASVEGLATELEQARQIALSERQASAAVQATMGKAKLFGLGKETRRIEGTVHVTTFNTQDLAKLTDEELDQLEQAILTMQRLRFLPGEGAAHNDNDADGGDTA